MRERVTDPTHVAITEARALLYGGERRLGRRPTVSTVMNIRTSDVRAFYEKRYAPGQAAVVAIGDFDPQAMLEKLRNAFATWRGPTSPAEITQEMPAQPDKKSRLVHMPGLKQGTLALGHWAPPARHPDLPAWQLLEYVLVGGDFSSRLMTAARSEAGKVYDISSVNLHLRTTSFSCLVTSTQNDEVGHIWELLERETAKILDENITEEELQKAKSHFAGRILLELELPAAIAERVLGKLHEGYTLEEMAEEINELNAVSLEDVQHVAKEWLKGTTSVLALVGDRRTLKELYQEMAASLGGFGEDRHGF